MNDTSPDPALNHSTDELQFAEELQQVRRTRTLPKWKLLIVDDEESIRVLFFELLSTLPAHCETAETVDLDHAGGGIPGDGLARAYRGFSQGKRRPGPGEGPG